MGLPLVVGLFHTGVTYCLYFFCAEGAARTRSRTFELHRSAGGRAGIRPDPGEQITAVQLFGGLLILGFTCGTNFRASGKRLFFGAGGSAAVIDESAW